MPGPIYCGVAIPGITSTSLDSFESLCGGKHVSIIGVGRTWYSGALYGQSGGAYAAFPTSSATLIHGRGGIFLYDWIQGNSFVSKLDDPSFNLRSVYLNHTHDAYIDSHAAAISALGFPIIVRIYHEMNGNWYESYDEAGPNNLGNGSGELILAWRYIVDRFRSNGVTNVAWAFCPNIQATSGGITSRAFTQFYPGDSYVDLKGLDGYNAANGSAWLTMQQVFTGGGTTGLQNSLDNILNHTGDSRIPFMIMETGCNDKDETGAVNGTKKAQWFTDGFGTWIPSVPQIQGVIYSHYIDGTSDWQIDYPLSGSGAGTTAPAYAAAIASSHYLQGNVFPLPSKIVPHFLSSDVTDHYRVTIKSNAKLVAYWRCTETSGTLTDDSGNAHTATSEGTVSYGNPSAVPANPADTSVGVAGGTTNDFNATNNTALSATTTNALFVEVSFVVSALPAVGSGNAHIVARGAQNQFQFSLYVNPSGQLFWNVWDLTAVNGSAASTASGAIVAGKRYLAQCRIDNVGKTLNLTVSSEDGIFWGNIVNTSAGYTLTLGASTAAFEIGRRAGSGDQSFNGHIGHVSVESALPSSTALQRNYAAWVAAPIISGVVVT